MLKPLSSLLYICLILSLYFDLSEGGVSAATFRNKMLSTHNTLRQKTARGNTPGQPAAKYMKKLKWDYKLSSVAKSWSQKCKWGHNPSAGQQYGKLSIAENIYGSAGYKENINNLLDSVTAWYNEYKDYRFQNGQNTGTTHYSIMMNADTTKIGCGYTMCSQLSGDSQLNSFNGKKMFVVCNYSPAGGNGSPYLAKGSSAFTYDDEEDGTGLSSTEIAAVVLCSVGCICFMIIAGLLYMKRRSKKFDMKEEVDDVEKDDDIENTEVADTPGSIDDDGNIDVTTTPRGDDQDKQEIEIEAYLEDTQ